MKKQNFIIPGIIIIIAIIVVLATVPWNQVKEEQAAGTIGKVDKYQSEQMGERSVKIRSEFVKDSALLIKTIKDLVGFTIFSNQTVLNIEKWWIPELKKYYSTSKSQSNIKELEDYVTLLKNSNQTLQDVIQILAEFYGGTNKDQTVDVEGKLIAFSNFVNQMIQRDSCFEAIITDIDQNIKNSKELKLRKEVISKLKAIRDRIMIDNLQYAIAIGDHNKATYVANQFLYDLDDVLQQYESNPEVISNTEDNFYSIPVINFIVQNRTIESITSPFFGSYASNISAGVTNYYSLGVVIFNQEAVQNSIKNNQSFNVQIGTVFNTELIKVQEISNQGGNAFYSINPGGISSSILSIPMGYFSNESALFNILVNNQFLAKPF